MPIIVLKEAFILLPTLIGVGGTEDGVNFHWHDRGVFFAPTGPFKKTLTLNRLVKIRDMSL